MPFVRLSFEVIFPRDPLFQITDQNLLIQSLILIMAILTCPSLHMSFHGGLIRLKPPADLLCQADAVVCGWLHTIEDYRQGE
jgi:hypothetical protein